ncbi:MAG TPA: hypothetical protein PKN99_14705 [Cyclobacteriaceae bacterium]|nr:hypothetical protein [Cyclobacteriaceae bacterium]
MKKIIIILLMVCYWSGFAQQFNETIKKELAFEKKSDKNALMIANINGSIKVEGYDGDKIVVEVNKEIMAKTNDRLEKGKVEIQLGVIDLADTLILYVKGTCSDFGRGNQRYHRNERAGKGWNYNWSNWGKDCKEEYRYLMNFTVKVPYGINLAVSTINDGDISVEKVSGGLYADNINGSIRLTHISGATHVSSINGDIDLTYDRNPSLPCRYYALNGDINIHVKKGLGASVSFESFNGNFYTNVDAIESLPVALEKRPKKDGVEYKINGSRYKVGSGGVFLDIETFNGDAYLKEI